MMSDAIEVLGWTLLHFVWQGAAVGVLAAMLLAALRRQSASARYLTGVAALGLMLALPLFTIARIERTPLPGDISPMATMRSTIEMPRTRDDGSAAMDGPPINVERIGIDFENAPPPDATPLIPVSESRQTRLDDLSEKRSAFHAESFFKPYIPWGVAAWLIGVGVLSLRLFASWWSVRCLRRRATQPAGETWQAILRRIAERLRVTRPVKLVESALVEVPAVIGWLRPVILIPATAITGLTTEQLEALLAHELAHVRRHDYLINLLQTVVETLLFYHPAVWWVSHRIRIEREHCCDDLAVQVCGDGLTYAKALVALEELRAPKLGLAMSSSGGSLRTRVARLLGQAEQQRRPTGWIAGLFSLVLLTMAGALGAGLLTPPENPTAGLSNVEVGVPQSEISNLKSQISNPKQETRAERELFVTVAESQTLDLEFEQSVKSVEGFDLRMLTVTTPSPTTARVKGVIVGLTIVTVTDVNGTEFAVPIEVLPKSNSELNKPATTTFRPKPRKNPLLRPIQIGQNKMSVVLGVQQPRFVEFPNRIFRIDGFDPLVINVGAMSPYQLRVTGQAIGKTSFTAGIEGDKPLTVEFEVTPFKHSRESIIKLFAAKDGVLPGELRISEVAGAGDPRRAQVDDQKAVQREELIPIHGQCVGAKTDQPIEDAEVRLYRLDRTLRKNSLIIATRTDATGRFDLGTFPELGEGQNYFVGVRAKGFASSLSATRHNRRSLERSAPLMLRLSPAATLSGTVLGPDDQPLADVKVNLGVDWIPGIRSTTTDAKGQFALDDVTEIVEGSGRGRMVLEHTELGRKDVWYSRCPDTLDVKFVAPAIVEGTVLNADGSPARNETLHCQSTQAERATVPGPAEHSVTTDDQGRYRFAFQVAGKINLLHMARNPDFVAEAIESIEVVNGQTVMARPMTLVKGCLIVGQVIDADTGKPVVIRPFESFHVGAHGPSRPNSSPMVVVAYVKPDGTYSLRVPPGRSYPYLGRSSNSTANGPNWSITVGAYDPLKALEQPIDVLEGQTIELNFEVSLTRRKNVPAISKLQSIERSSPDAALNKSDARDGRGTTNVGRFVGRVRLKTEKALPDLEKVAVPAGKVLDESLVFSKDGGLANVFVYLRKPTFPIEPPAEAKLAKPFVLIAEDGKFWPHAAMVRVGQPIVLENRDIEGVNFHLQLSRNGSQNIAVVGGERFRGKPFSQSESYPLPVTSDLQPWKKAHLFAVDHPFVAVTDHEGHFVINGLPPGEHELLVWHERVGYLEKSLVITIKPGEDARSELEYAPDRLKLTEAEVLAWGNRLIDAKWIPRAIVPRPAAPKKEDEGKADLSETPDTKQPPQKQLKVETEAEQARRAIIRQRAENDVTVRFAKKSAEVAKAEWEKLLAANRSVPGAISESEVRRAKAKYEIALLQIEHAEAERAAVRSQLEDKTLDEPSPKTVELRQRAAKTAAEIAKANAEIVKAAIEHAVVFLKAQQQDSGAWQGTPADGVTALCAAALLQAGVKTDDPVMQRALAHLRKVEQSLSYTVALQTMVFCWASPKEDAELILRNVEWLQKAQVTEGEMRGAWSYAVTNLGVGDSSCSRFAVMGLHAAKRAGFEVKAETWRHVSDYWLTTQKDQGRWGYTPQSAPTPTMTLAGIACLATANRYLPQDEQTKTREAAMRKPAEYLEKVIPDLTKAGFAFYALQSLERAGHTSGIKEFGKLDWQADLTKRLLETQHPNGSWKGSTPTESDLIATSFALLALTGQPEPKLVGYRLRFEPRDPDKKLQMQSNLIENSSPTMQRTVISGGVRIEFHKPDGLKCRIEADRAIIESDARVYEELELNPGSDVMRIECIGSVKCEDRRGAESTQLTAERLWFDVHRNLIRIDKPGSLP